MSRLRRLTSALNDDSNGLSIHAGNGEWIWRPLNNPKHLAVSSFAMKPRALVATQCQFPALKIWTTAMICACAWVTPKGDWGKKYAELVERTNDETNDNIGVLDRISCLKPVKR
ncbi:MAG: glucan biosynthesis protein [Enterobacter hormaechei]